MSAPKSIPRWSLAALSGLVCAVLAWAAWLLPWREWTVFAVVTGLLACVHGATAAAAALGHPMRARLWRMQALGALAYQAWLTWSLIRSAVYVAEVYGGMGEGIAAGLLAIIAVLALLLVPTSVWALAVTGGVRRTPAGTVAGASAAALAGWSLWGTAQAAQLQPSTTEDPQSLQALVQRTITARAGKGSDRVSLMRREAVQCPAGVLDAAATVVATFVGSDPAGGAQADSVCVQEQDIASALAALQVVLDLQARPGPVKVDIITGTRALEPLTPVVDSLSVRPGLDGICEDTRCLMPWQMVALEAFGENMPFSVVPDFRFGVDPRMLRAALRWPDSAGRPAPTVDGLVRVSTASFVVDPQGATHVLRRLRTQGPALTRASVAEAIASAEGYILDAQLPDGRFKYTLHPMTGQVTQHGFSLARQAGTTLVTCELAQDRARAKEVATAAIEMMVGAGHRSGELMGLVYPPGADHTSINLGNTALASIAMLSCRDLVGDRFDAEIGAMTRFLLNLQRDDGGFNPGFSIEDAAPIQGADPLFAVGQAVYALSLLERLVRSEALPALPTPARVHEAVERSMNYTANEFWHFFGRDFFWVEENWHCLAARASLGHHRHDGYERFCVEYATFKARLVLDQDSGVDPDYVGGVNIGNLTPPQTTATSGLSEALAAAAAIARVRGEDSTVFEGALRTALPFVLHNQWRAEHCFACTKEHRVVGAFSEHVGSPQIRIDYVQHAMASLGHGGRILGLVEGSSVPRKME